MNSCKTLYCRNKVEKKNQHCNTCKGKIWREKNPLKYTYNNLKNNSKRRNKEFDLTLEQFKVFCVKTDYIKGKGRTRNSYSIDRIDSEKRYNIDNIQILTVSENSRKQKYLKYDYETKEAIVETLNPPIINENEDLF